MARMVNPPVALDLGNQERHGAFTARNSVGELGSGAGFTAAGSWANAPVYSSDPTAARTREPWRRCSPGLSAPVNTGTCGRFSSSRCETRTPRPAPAKRCPASPDAVDGRRRWLRSSMTRAAIVAEQPDRCRRSRSPAPGRQARMPAGSSHETQHESSIIALWGNTPPGRRLQCISYAKSPLGGPGGLQDRHYQGDSGHAARPVVRNRRHRVARRAKAEEAAARLASEGLWLYQEMLDDPAIEAVLQSFPTLARPWSIRAAEAGKHVLCENPSA